jgi:hypothetical protein
MDFTWVTTDDANAIQNSIVDAKGDLISASANDTPARLAVGANGETLVADSSTSTGLRYTAGTVQANPVLNSAMQIWQRGTSIALSASTAYTADRWQGRTGSGAQTISRQVTNDTTNLPFIQYCARVGRNSGNTGTGIILFEQSMETINTIPFVGKTVTLSLYARKGANFSATSDLMYAAVVTGTGTDQNVSGYTGGANTILGSATLTTTWQRFTFTGTIPTTVTEMGVQLSYTPTGTAGAADYLEVTGVQIDIGSVALPFRTYAGTLQGELAACQRYLPAFVGSAAEIATGYAIGANSPLAFIRFNVTPRVAPTGMTSAGNWRWYALNTGTVAGVSFNAANTTGASVTNTTGVTITAGQGTRLYGDDASATIFFTGCEL